MKKILIIYFSNDGSTEKMAEKISHGVNSVDNAEAVLRTIPKINDSHADSIANENNILYATNDDLKDCDALIMGSPTHFGNMAAPMKFFLDGTTAEWFNNTLCGKPAGVFTSTSSIHGGQESTLLSMMLPLLHHGMIISGIPYSNKELSETRTGGTPYGPTHFSGDGKNKLSDSEAKLCFSFGERIAKLALKL
jgi:NAD(P)H dehydrogenase (quinone)